MNVKRGIRPLCLIPPVGIMVLAGSRKIFAVSEQASQPASETGALIFFGLVVLVIGLIALFFPRVFWWIRIGRKVPGAKPITAYLNLIRFGGILVCALALVMLFAAF